jgi:hypothetical protein
LDLQFQFTIVHKIRWVADVFCKSPGGFLFMPPCPSLRSGTLSCPPLPSRARMQQYYHCHCGLVCPLTHRHTSRHRSACRQTLRVFASIPLVPCRVFLPAHRHTDNLTAVPFAVRRDGIPPNTAITIPARSRRHHYRDPSGAAHLPSASHLSCYAAFQRLTSCQRPGARPGPRPGCRPGRVRVLDQRRVYLDRLSQLHLQRRRRHDADPDHHRRQCAL